jgi:hypothetical protein
MSYSGTYDFSKYSVIVGGLMLSGFSDGDAATAKRDEDLQTKKVGIDGAVAFSRSANKSGEISIKLLQTSAANEMLSELFAIDNLVMDGLLDVPIAIVDGLGTSIVSASQCRLKSIPEFTRGKEVGENEWVFDAVDLTIFHGTNY